MYPPDTSTDTTRAPVARPVPRRPAPAPSRTAPTRRRRPLSGWIAFHATPLAAFLWSRVLVFGAAVVSVAFINHDPAKGSWPRLGGPQIPLWQTFARWDGGWYLDVATRGYAGTVQRSTGDASQAFFPAFPLSTRALSSITGLPALATALILNLVLGAVGAVVVWRLVRHISGQPAADRAVALFCFAPGAFVLSMVYSEALFITAVAVSLLLLVRRNWYWAGVAGAVATATRPTGVALVLACAAAAFVAIKRERDWHALGAVAIAPLGVLAYFAYLWQSTGHFTAWFKVQRTAWADYIAPVQAAVERWNHLRSGYVPNVHTEGLNDLLWAAGVVVGVAGVVLLLRWRPPLPVTVYGIAAATFAVTSHAVGLRPRMILTAFPLILAAGVRITGWKFRALMATSVVGMVLMAVFSFSTFAAIP